MSASQASTLPCPPCTYQYSLAVTGKARDAAAMGYILKEEPGSLLQEAVRTVQMGETFFVECDMLPTLIRYCDYAIWIYYLIEINT